MKFRVARRAERQIHEASKWWARNRSSAPALFAEELHSAFALIEEFPHSGEPVRHRRLTSLRRVLLSRAQYHLYYTFDDEAQVVEVVALWHTSRGRVPRV